MTELSIAVLGANSHIAKFQIQAFLKAGGCKLHLYTTRDRKVQEFLERACAGSESAARVHLDYVDFPHFRYDAILNCIGAGANPAEAFGPSGYLQWFELSEAYDRMCLDYCQRSPKTLLIGLSSGAVYGNPAHMPAAAWTDASFRVNALLWPDYYAISKLNSEAKHRACGALSIVDIRVFSYFSRYAKLDSGYLASDAARSILENSALAVDSHDIARDYVSPDDLHSSIRGLAEAAVRGAHVNGAIDARSAGFAWKFSLLEMLASEFGLRYLVSDAAQKGLRQSPKVYASLRRSEWHKPALTAEQAVKIEMKELLKLHGKA